MYIVPHVVLCDSEEIIKSIYYIDNPRLGKYNCSLLKTCLSLVWHL